MLTTISCSACSFGHLVSGTLLYRQECRRPKMVTIAENNGCSTPPINASHIHARTRIRAGGAPGQCIRACTLATAGVHLFGVLQVEHAVLDRRWGRHREHIAKDAPQVPGAALRGDGVQHLQHRAVLRRGLGQFAAVQELLRAAALHGAQIDAHIDNLGLARELGLELGTDHPPVAELQERGAPLVLRVEARDHFGEQDPDAEDVHLRGRGRAGEETNTVQGPRRFIWAISRGGNHKKWRVEGGLSALLTRNLKIESELMLSAPPSGQEGGADPATLQLSFKRQEGRGVLRGGAYDGTVVADDGSVHGAWRGSGG